MYIIEDGQNPGRYFAEKARFKSKKEVREHLISYHCIDTDIKWLNSMTLKQICSEFIWIVHKINERE